MPKTPEERAAKMAQIKTQREKHHHHYLELVDQSPIKEYQHIEGCVVNRAEIELLKKRLDRIEQELGLSPE